MKLMVWLMSVVLFLSAGCTNLSPIEMESGDLRKKIVSGEVLKAGDRATVVTEDGENHRVKVQEVTQEKLVTKKGEIPIDQIIAVSTREFAGGKTAALTIGTIALLAYLGAALATAALVGNIG